MSEDQRKKLKNEHSSPIYTFFRTKFISGNRIMYICKYFNIFWYLNFTNRQQITYDNNTYKMAFSILLRIAQHAMWSFLDCVQSQVTMVEDGLMYYKLYMNELTRCMSQNIACRLPTVSIQKRAYVIRLWPQNHTDNVARRKCRKASFLLSLSHGQ